MNVFFLDAERDHVETKLLPLWFLVSQHMRLGWRALGTCTLVFPSDLSIQIFTVSVPVVFVDLGVLAISIQTQRETRCRGVPFAATLTQCSRFWPELLVPKLDFVASIGVKIRKRRQN